MKNNDLYLLQEAINSVKEKGDNRFKLLLIINEKKVTERIEVLSELREKSDEYKEFEQKRQELIMNHAELDEQGNVIVYSEPNGGGKRSFEGYGFPNIVKEPKAYQEAFNKLREEYAGALEEEMKKEEEFNKTLKEPVEPEIEFSKIPFDNVPEIGFDELKTLMPMIEDGAI